MSSFLRSNRSKPVRDAENRLVGCVLASEIDSTVGDPVSLLVEIRHEAARSAGVSPAPNGSACWLSFDRVRSIRRDAIHLHDSIGNLLRENGRRP